MPESGVTIGGVSFYETRETQQRVVQDRNLGQITTGGVESQLKTISSDPKHPTLIAVGSVNAAIYLVKTVRFGILVRTNKPQLRTAESESTYPSGPTLIWGCGIYDVSQPKKSLSVDGSGCFALQYGREYAFRLPVREP